jgi:hypothetical protein
LIVVSRSLSGRSRAIFIYHNTAQPIFFSDVSRNRTTTGDGKRRPVSLFPYLPSAVPYIAVSTSLHPIIIIIITAFHTSFLPFHHQLSNVNIEYLLQTQ